MSFINAGYALKLKSAKLLCRLQFMSQKAQSSNKIRILEGALQVLAEKGFAGLTIQKISERVEVSLGNLTYHFPNREILIQSMLDFWFAGWKQEFQTRIIDVIDPEHPDIESFIDWVMEQAVYPENVAVFTELWAYSSHNAAVAHMLENLYLIAVRTVTLAFGLNPDDPQSEAFQSQLYVLAALSEGSAAVLGNASPQHPQRKILKQNVVKLMSAPLLLALNSAKPAQ